jgi:hypothetical protein
MLSSISYDLLDLIRSKLFCLELADFTAQQESCSVGMEVEFKPNSIERGFLWFVKIRVCTACLLRAYTNFNIVWQEIFLQLVFGIFRHSRPATSSTCKEIRRSGIFSSCAPHWSFSWAHL